MDRDADRAAGFFRLPLNEQPTDEMVAIYNMVMTATSEEALAKAFDLRTAILKEKNND